jgi:hypothetical protein
MLIPSLFSKENIDKRHKIQNTYKTLNFFHFYHSKTIFQTKTKNNIQNEINYYSLKLAKVLYTSSHLTMHQHLIGSF